MYSLLSHALHANSSCTAASQAYLLNHQVHELVNHQKNETRDQSMKLAIDVDKFVATMRSVAPDLWELVCEITQSVNECKERSTSVDRVICRSYQALVQSIHCISHNLCH